MLNWPNLSEVTPSLVMIYSMSIFILVIAIGALCTLIKQFRPAWAVYRYMLMIAVVFFLLSILAILILLGIKKPPATNITDQQLATEIQNVLPPLLTQREKLDKKVEVDWEIARNSGAENPALIQPISQILKVHDQLTRCGQEFQSLASLDYEFPKQLAQALLLSPMGGKITASEVKIIQREFPSDLLRDLDTAKYSSVVSLLTSLDVLMNTQGQWSVLNNQILFNDSKALAEYNRGMTGYKQSLDLVNSIVAKLQRFSVDHAAIPQVPPKNE